MISKKRINDIYTAIEKNEIKIPTGTLSMLEFDLMYTKAHEDIGGFNFINLMEYFFIEV